MTTTTDIVQKLWNLCHVLRDDGITYHEYVSELTWLLFLKMAKETGREKQLPKAYRWDELMKREGNEQLRFYKELLLHLGTEASSRVQAIYVDASTALTVPRNLKKLVDSIDELDWYSAKSEGLGDLYEGLLEKNASEKKSGAGQYFTPRPLIDCIVTVMQPQAGELIQDPAAGTAGFLIAADRYIKKRTDELFSLNEEQQVFQRQRAFFGVELVPDTRRLALMNLMLHDIDGDLQLGDALSPLGAELHKAELIMTNPPFGTILDRPMATSQDFVNWICGDRLDPEFLMWLLMAEHESLWRFGKGSTHTTIYFPEVQAFHVCTPSRDAQRRIVEKIEALTAKSRRAKEALDAIPPLLERFRQSVLAAAFRGDLTKDWREQNPDVEPADQLLARIRRERRARWEHAELERLRAKGKVPKGHEWKKKYVEPEPVDVDGLPELPTTWGWAAAEEVSWELTVGHVGSMQHEYCEDGVPFLRSQNVRANRFDPEGLCYISADFHRKLSKSRLRPGDVVVVRSGAPGTACVVPAELPDANCSDLVIVRLLPGLVPALLAYFMNSTQARAGVRGVQVGVAQQHFNVGSMKRMAVPLMSAGEQQELLRRIHVAFQACNSIDARVADAQRTAAGLDSSILAKAFRGELVSSHDDRSAAVRRPLQQLELIPLRP